MRCGSSAALKQVRIDEHFGNMFPAWLWLLVTEFNQKCPNITAPALLAENGWLLTKGERQHSARTQSSKSATGI
jgi:hypothetical protein